MKLPNADRAVVEIEKLRDYCLNMSHPRGRHKARVFATALDITANEAEILRDAILSAAQNLEATSAERDKYGQRFMLNFSMEHNGKQAVIRSSWIVRSAEDYPRLTSCYVL